MAIYKIFFTAALTLWVSACTQVNPWQRDQLALESMQSGIDPLHDTLSNHIYFAKEASSGGSSSAGGGCGCN